MQWRSEFGSTDNVSTPLAYDRNCRVSKKNNMICEYRNSMLSYVVDEFSIAIEIIRAFLLWSWSFAGLLSLIIQIQLIHS